MNINGVKVLKNGLIATLLVAGTMPSALAQLTYQGATVYRVGTTELVFSGTTGTKIPVDLGPYTKTTTKTATNCGLVKIKTPKAGLSNLVVNGTSINTTGLTTATSPRCTNGTLKTPLSSPIETAAGTIIVPGLTPNTSVPVSYSTDKIKNVTINACGFGAIKVTATLTALPATFSINGTSYTTASLPDAGEAPKLIRTNGVATCYTKTGWTN
jgi:hypothetical protein